jgi:hypothetical protein
VESVFLPYHGLSQFVNSHYLSFVTACEDL